MPLEQLIADLTAALIENTKVQREALEAYMADRSPAAPKPRTRKAAAPAEAPAPESEPTPVVAEPAQEPEPETTPVAEEEPEPLVVAYDDDKVTDADLEVLRAINKDRQMKAGVEGKLGTYKERLLEVLKKHGITKFPDLKTKASVAAFKADLEAIAI